MFDFIGSSKPQVPRKSLYCVWIKARAGDDAPLLRVRIDPSMGMFESRAMIHEPDVAAALAESQAALSEESSS